MGLIIIAFTVFLILQILAFGSLIEISIVQSFILLAILIYIPQMYEIYHKEDIWKFSIISSIFITISFSFSQGVISSLFTIPWIISSVFIILKNPPKLQFTPNSILVLSSKLFTIAGSFVLLISRLGLQPVGFSHTLIELTVIHFHYAGILIPLFMVNIHSEFQSDLSKGLSYLISAGTGIVAIGITIGKFISEVGIFAVIFFTLPLVILSLMVVRGNFNLYLKIAHLLLVISMVLAIYYAIGVSFGIDTINIPNMIITHGVINGLFFVPLSIFGWFKQFQS